MDKISILIPYKPNHENREAPFHWLMKFYKKLLPQAEICVGSCESPLFSRSIAINNAATKATGNIYVIADADIVCNPTLLSQSPFLLKKYHWVIPYSTVMDLSQYSTNNLLKIEPAWPINVHLSGSPRYIGKQVPVGGISIVKRQSFEAVGGFDERFKGWGGEDDAFACSMDTICGPYTRLNTEVYHLWHEKQSGKNNPNYAINLKLAQTYKSALGNLQQIRKMIQER